MADPIDRQKKTPRADPPDPNSGPQNAPTPPPGPSQPPPRPIPIQPVPSPVRPAGSEEEAGAFDFADQADGTTGRSKWVKTKRRRQSPLLLGVVIAVGFAVIGGLIAAIAGRKPPPVLDPIADQVVDELTLLEFTAGVRNKDKVRGSLEYTLVGAPEGAQIDPETGRFTWRPSEEQGPQWYELAVRVTGRGKRDRSLRKFGVEVREVSQSPVMEPIEEQTVEVGGTLALVVTAEDPDVPAQPVRYRLGPGAPAGTRIEPTSGRLVWQAQDTKPGEVYEITIEAGKAGGDAVARQTFPVRVVGPRLPTPEDADVAVDGFIDALRAEGATVAASTEPLQHPALTGKTRLLSIGGQKVGVFGYPDADAARNDIRRFKPDDLEPFAKSQPAPTTAHLFHKERLIAFYVGRDTSLLGLLDSHFGRPAVARAIEAMPVAEDVPDDKPDEPDGDEVILDLYRKNRLLSKSEYPTLRSIYAARFENQHEAQIQQAFGDKEGELRRWLEDRVDIKEELFLAIDPEHDDLQMVLDLFRTLKEEFPEKFEAYANLAIAVSVVWDKERGAIHGSPRGQHKSLQPQGEVGAIQNFRYFLDTEKSMQGRAQFLPWEFLVYMVNHRTTFMERQWALANYLPKRSMIGKCYGDVPYDGDMLNGLSPRLEGRPHTLPNIRQYGGVCSCQADYAARVAKSLGVPAFYANAKNKFGDSHAWVMWVELGTVTRTGFTFSLESHGRYRGDKYYVGNVGDPHTGLRTTDREVELRLHTVGMDPIAKRQADLVMRSYPMLRERTEMDTTEQLLFLSRVVEFCPGNEQAWITLASMSREGQITKTNSKPMVHVLNRLFTTFAKIPDFTWVVFDDMVAFQDIPKQRAALFSRLAAMYEQAGRPDLSCEARLKYTDYLVADERYREAIEALTPAILMFPDEGRYVPRMLDKLEELCGQAEGSKQLVLFYQQLLPKIPQKRGDSPSDFCMEMYERGIKLFREAGLLPLAQAYEAQLATLEAAKRG